MKNSTVAIVSDLHIGVHRSNEKFLEEDLKYANFLVDNMILKDVDTLLVLGDVFHNRREVSLSAIQTAKRFFETIVNAGIHVVILAGNHDCWNDGDANITSVSMFAGWDNIDVVSTHPVAGEVDGQSYMILPWGFGPSDVPNHVDVLFGHFEINTFKMTSGTVCENGITTGDIERVCDKCFSGHFHLRDMREGKGGKLICYVGSAMPLDWGDYGSAMKAICYYNFKTRKTEFVENTVSPIFKKIPIDVILKCGMPDAAPNEYTAELKRLVYNNFVRIVSPAMESKVDKTKISTAISMVKSLNPFEVQCDIRNDEQPAIVANNVDLTSLDAADALMQYVKSLKSEYSEDALVLLKRVYTAVG